MGGFPHSWNRYHRRLLHHQRTTAHSVGKLACPQLSSAAFLRPRREEGTAFALPIAPDPYFCDNLLQARYPPAAWIHSLQCTPGAQVAVRAGGNFTLAPAFRSLDHVREIASAVPSGSKPTSDAVPHILLIAGGVGINPLYSMLLQLAATDSCASDAVAQPSVPFVTLLWSVRTLNDAFLLPQLRTLARWAGASCSPLAGRLKLVLSVTRQEVAHDLQLAHNVQSVSAAAGGRMCNAADDASYGAADAGEVLLRSGRMSPALLQRLARGAPHSNTSGGGGSSSDGSPHSLSTAHVYPSSTSQRMRSKHAFVCGPPSMTECAARVIVIPDYCSSFPPCAMHVPPSCLMLFLRVMLHLAHVSFISYSFLWDLI